jgi:hypothetical protein
MRKWEIFSLISIFIIIIFYIFRRKFEKSKK